MKIAHLGTFAAALIVSAAASAMPPLPPGAENKSALSSRADKRPPAGKPPVKASPVVGKQKPAAQSTIEKNRPDSKFATKARQQQEKTAPGAEKKFQTQGTVQAVGRSRSKP